MQRAEFEPAIPATKRPQTYALDRAATGIGVYLPVRHPLKFCNLIYLYVTLLHKERIQIIQICVSQLSLSFKINDSDHTATFAIKLSFQYAGYNKVSTRTGIKLDNLQR
jgi:hypothetical protein